MDLKDPKLEIRRVFLSNLDIAVSAEIYGFFIAI
jgi:hypothetical protein